MPEQPGVALATGTLGHVAVVRGDPERARRLLAESLQLYRELGDDWFVAVMLNLQARIAFAEGDLERAAAMFVDALYASREVGDTLPLLMALYNLGLTHRGRDDRAAATSHFAEGLSLAATVGDRGSVAYFLAAIASIASADGEDEAAAALDAAADALYDQVGSAWLETYSAEYPSRTFRTRGVGMGPSPERAMDWRDAVSYARQWSAGRA